MRLLILTVVVAACGGSEDGAILTVSAPSGPESADRLEIVLAGAETVATVERQRLRPGSFENASVRYYRQRASGGEVLGVSTLDGFVIRIEPNVEQAADEQFVPLLVAYRGENVVGIGAVVDENGNPAPVEIKDGELAEYIVAMVPLTVTDAADGLDDGEIVSVPCRGGNTAELASGYAWQPPDRAQLRLLLPDKPGSQDASARTIDLDCDAHAAPDTDCDDLRSAFHDDQIEMCDALDTNCDGDGLIVQTCPTEASACSGATDRGVQLCDDRTGETLGECTPDPACRCSVGSPGPCTKCVLSFVRTNDPSRIGPCAPAIGKIMLPMCTDAAPCDVRVVPQVGPWKAYISADGQSFATDVADAHGTLYIEAKTIESDVMATAPASIGGVYLAVTRGTTTVQIGIDLEVGSESIDNCAEAVDPSSGMHQMLCSP